MDMSSAKDHCWTLTAGAAATAVMMGTSRAMQSPVMSDLQELAATAAAPPGSRLGEAFGYSAQLFNGAVFTEVYRRVFDAVGVPPSAASGAAIGLVHGALAGVLLGVVPPLHPRVPQPVPAPGPFMRRRGLSGAFSLIALHGLYGALVGASMAALTKTRELDDISSVGAETATQRMHKMEAAQ